MKPDKFIEIQDKKNDVDYGLCTPPTTADEGMRVLIDHFLGEDWYAIMPMSTEQIYTEAIYRILEKNQKSIFNKLFK